MRLSFRPLRLIARTSLAALVLMFFACLLDSPSSALPKTGGDLAVATPCNFPPFPMPPWAKKNLQPPFPLLYLVPVCTGSILPLTIVTASITTPINYYGSIATLPILPCQGWQPLGYFPPYSLCKDDRMKNLVLANPISIPQNTPCVGVGCIAQEIPIPPSNLTSAEIAIQVAGPSNGVQGVFPNTTDFPKGMPHKDTQAISLAQTYPWLYKEVDPAPGVQYTLYRGTGNNTGSQIDSGVQVSVQSDDASDTSQYNPAWIDFSFIQKDLQCIVPQHKCSGAEDPDNYQYWARLVRDSCTNQYILPMGLNPKYVFSSGYRHDGLPWNESVCQPMITTPVPCMPDLVKDHTGKTCLVDNGEAKDFAYSKHVMYDYRAWGYLERAWTDVLDTDYSPATSADPNKLIVSNSAGLIGVTNITGERQYGAPFNSGSPGDHGNGTAVFKGKLTTINQLGQRPYERIWDSTHPFTPRWDMYPYSGSTGLLNGQDPQYPPILTDRDYSPGTWLGAAIPPTRKNTYWPGTMSNPPYTPFDYLITGGTGYTFNWTKCNVRCAVIPVDVLKFRYAEFDACMSCRIAANTDCFWGEWFWGASGLDVWFFGWRGPGCRYKECIGAWPWRSYKCWISSFWHTVTGTSCKENLGYCKTRYQKQKNNINKLWPTGNWPPCSTTFDYPFDFGPYQCRNCLKLANDYSTNDCGKGNSCQKRGKHWSSVTKCCSDLAQAVAGVNTLKIRNLQDDPKLKDNFGSGNIAEGYRFADYFAYTGSGFNKCASGSNCDFHMPFMRWWDTGNAAGGVDLVVPNTAPYYGQHLGTNYDPWCDKGKDDVIVGVGAEGTKNGSPAGLCRYGGGAGKGYKCISVGNPDRLTSWYELKQYQTNSMRNFGLNCLPIYEQMWKTHGAEDYTLAKAGRHINSVWGEPNDTSESLYEYQNVPWPLRWRGYLSDSQHLVGGAIVDEYRFPNFDIDTTTEGNNGDWAVTSEAYLKGLDNAKSGDIIYIRPSDDAATKDQVAPFMAVVTYANHNGLGNETADPTKYPNGDPTATCSDFIQVVDVNNGKYPDVCGNTDYVGMGQTRTIYKGWLPINVQDVLFGGGDTFSDYCGDTHTSTNPNSAGPEFSAAGSCVDPKYASCTFAPSDTSKKEGHWKDVHIYRPSADERGHNPPSR